MPLITALDDIRQILQDTRTVAVLGAHPQPSRAAFYVPEYLHRAGYKVFAVNPAKVGTELWGEPVRASLGELTAAVGPVDLVDVFRRSDAIPAHLDEILSMDPLPRVVWLQQGIRHDATAEALSARGISVVQDRCTLADHRRLLAR